MRDYGWLPCKAEPDLWLKDAGDNYEITSVYVDDTLHSSRNPSDFTDCLAKKHDFKFKHEGELDYFLGANIERNKNTGGHLTFGLRTYVAKILENYQRMFEELPKHSKCLIKPEDHPEIDESSLMDADGVKRYQSLMGMLQWVVDLERINIYCAVMIMGASNPCKGRTPEKIE